MEPHETSQNGRHIVLISNGFQPKYEAGFANGLAKNNVKVTLIACDATLLESLDEQIEVKPYRGSIDPSRSPVLKLWQLIQYYVLLAIYLSQHNASVHIIGLLQFKRQPMLWRWELGFFKLFSNQLILSVHNLVPHGKPTHYERKRLSHCYQTPDILVVHTDKMKQALVNDYGVDQQQIVTVQLGVNQLPDLSERQSKQAKSKFGFKEKDQVVLLLGSVCHYKGFDLFLESMLRFSRPNHHFSVLIAGLGGDKAYNKLLKQQIEALQKEGVKVVWVNRYLSEAEVDLALKAADIMALPYRHIDQSGVLLTGLEYGLPIVAFDVGAIRDYIQPGQGKVVPPNYLEEFMRAVDSQQISFSLKASIQQFTQQYFWHETLKPLISLYQNSHQAQGVKHVEH